MHFAVPSIGNDIGGCGRNPGSHRQLWLPWKALVEGYILKLQESRFWSAFERVCREVDAKLSQGKLSATILARA